MTSDAVPTSAEQAELFNKRILLQALASHGIGQAAVVHSGCGDEGSASFDSFLDSSGQELSLGHPADLAEVSVWRAALDDERQSIYQAGTAGLPDALVEFAEQLLDRLHGGWENGDGAEGRTLFNPGSDQIVVEHDDLYAARQRTETVL